MTRALKALLLAVLVATATLLAAAPETASQVASIIRDRRGGDITASGGTLNLNRCAGDLCDMTTTGVISGVTLQDGYERKIRFTGVATLSGTSLLILPTSTNTITTAAGDYATFRGYASNVVRLVDYQRKDGTALAGAGGTLTTRGDLLTHSGSAESRIPISGANTILRSDGTDPAWAGIATVLDGISASVSQGAILYRNATSWSILPASTSGYVLSTRGTNNNPAWAAGSSSVTMSSSSFSASGTFTPGASTRYFWVRGVAPGGGGGNTGAAASGSSAGGGGGAGEYVESLFTTTQITGATTITCGTAGAGATAAGGTGTTGGNLTFGALFTAIGGAGGVGTAGAENGRGGAGGRGGTGTVDVRIAGMNGESGNQGALNASVGGSGGDSGLGAGGARITNTGTTSTPGNAGLRGGGGSAGVQAGGSGDSDGGAGGPCYVLIYEFSWLGEHLRPANDNDLLRLVA